MNQFAALGDPARARIVERLAAGEQSAGALGDLVGEEFGLSQPATSRHLRVLREADLVESRVDGTRRIYRLRPDGVEQIGDWVDRLRGLWQHSLSALETEIARGARERTDREDTR